MYGSIDDASTPLTVRHQPIGPLGVLSRAAREGSVIVVNHRYYLCSRGLELHASRNVVRLLARHGEHILSCPIIYLMEYGGGGRGWLQFPSVEDDGYQLHLRGG